MSIPPEEELEAILGRLNDNPPTRWEEFRHVFAQLHSVVKASPYLISRANFPCSVEHADYHYPGQNIRVNSILHYLVLEGASLDEIRQLHEFYHVYLPPTSTPFGTSAHPLHLACYFPSQKGVIEFLAEEYPGAVSFGVGSGVLPLNFLLLQRDNTNNLSLPVIKKLLEIYPESLLDGTFVEQVINEILDEDIKEFLLDQFGSVLPADKINQLECPGSQIDQKMALAVLPLVETLQITLGVEEWPKQDIWPEIWDLLSESHRLKELWFTGAFPHGHEHRGARFLQNFLLKSSSIERLSLTFFAPDSEIQEPIYSAISEAVKLNPGTSLKRLVFFGHTPPVPAHYVSGILEACTASLLSVTWTEDVSGQGICALTEAEFNACRATSIKHLLAWEQGWRSGQAPIAHNNLLNSVCLTLNPDWFSEENGQLWATSLTQELANSSVQRMLIEGRPTAIEQVYVDPFFHIVHKMQKLERLTFNACTVDSMVLRQFLRDCHVRSLELLSCIILGDWRPLDCSNNDVGTSSSRSLKHLLCKNIIVSKDGKSGLLSLMSGMQHLESLGLSVEVDDEGPIDCLDAVVPLIQGNRLKMLFLNTPVTITEEFCNALATNSSLKKLCIHEDLAEASLELLAGALAYSNTSLECADWNHPAFGSDCSRHFLRKIKFAVLLNKFGRQKARDPTTSHAEFVTLLCAVAEDSSLWFWFGLPKPVCSMHYGLLHESPLFLNGWEYSQGL